MKNKLLKILLCTSALFVIFLALFIIKPIQYNMGIKMIEKMEYEKAFTIFNKLENYKDSTDKVLETKYQLAIKKMNLGEKEAALAVFMELNNYKESMEYIKEIKYIDAIEFKQKGEYRQGIKLFEMLGDFKDSKEQLLETKYEMAIFLKNENKVKEAIKIFEELGEYKDASTQKKMVYFDNEKFEMVKNLLGTSYNDMISIYGEIVESRYGREGCCGRYRHTNADFWVEYSQDNQVEDNVGNLRWIPDKYGRVVWITGDMDCFVINGSKKINKEDFRKIFPYVLSEPRFIEESGIQVSVAKEGYEGVYFWCSGYELDFERSKSENINAIKRNNDPIILYDWRIS